jgi:hypothetical protein
MIEFGFYLCCGIILALMVPVYVILERIEPTEKKKKKRGLPDEKKGCCLFRFMIITALVFFGPFFLFMAVQLSFDVIDDWKSYRILREKGELQHAPLIDVQTDKHCSVAYEYVNTTHWQLVDGERCRQFREDGFVPILVYGDLSRIAGEEVNYEIVTAIPLMGTIGLLITGAVLVHFFKRLRSRFNRIKQKND